MRPGPDPCGRRCARARSGSGCVRLQSGVGALDHEKIRTREAIRVRVVSVGGGGGPPGAAAGAACGRERIAAASTPRRRRDRACFHACVGCGCPHARSGSPLVCSRTPPRFFARELRRQSGANAASGSPQTPPPPAAVSQHPGPAGCAERSSARDAGRAGPTGPSGRVPGPARCGLAGRWLVAVTRPARWPARAWNAAAELPHNVVVCRVQGGSRKECASFAGRQNHPSSQPIISTSCRCRCARL